MDLLINVERPSEDELRAAPATSSDRARERVAGARERQRRRLEGTGASCNGEMDARLARRSVRLEESADRVLAQAYGVGALSARGRHRVVRVAQTIADLEGHDRIVQADVLTALSLRQRSAAETTLAA